MSPPLSGQCSIWFATGGAGLLLITLHGERTDSDNRNSRHTKDCLDEARHGVFGEVETELSSLDLGDIENGVDDTEQVYPIHLHAIDDANRSLGQLSEAPSRSSSV
jgi:hypothetical protein